MTYEKYSEEITKRIDANLNGLYFVGYITDDGIYHKLITDDYDTAVDFLAPLLTRDGIL